MPAVVHSYAPIGETPVLYEHLSRDHLSATSGITPEGKLYMQEQEGALKEANVVEFLKHLLRRIAGKHLVVWDCSPIHRSRAIKRFLEDGTASWLQLEQRPGYAPELNPDEGTGKHLKCVKLKNVSYQSLSRFEPRDDANGEYQSEWIILTR